MESNLNSNRTPHCAPGRKKGGAPCPGVLTESRMEIATGSDKNLQRHSWLAGEVNGDVYCFKSTSTGEQVGPGTYNTEDSFAPEKPAHFKSHNYLVRKSQEVAKQRSEMWVQRKMFNSQMSQNQGSVFSQYSPVQPNLNMNMMNNNNPQQMLQQMPLPGHDVTMQPQFADAQHMAQPPSTSSNSMPNGANTIGMMEQQPQLFVNDPNSMLNGQQMPSTQQQQQLMMMQQQQQFNNINNMNNSANSLPMSQNKYGVIGKNNIAMSPMGGENSHDMSLTNKNQIAAGVSPVTNGNHGGITLDAGAGQQEYSNFLS